MTPITVKLTQIRKSFGGQEVLRGIDLAARDGDVIAIIGASGSGKSTLLRCIQRFGSVRRRERLPSSMRKSATRGPRVTASRGLERQIRCARLRRRSWAWCFSSFNLFPHLTALENVLAGPALFAQDRSRAECRTRKPASCWSAKVGLGETSSTPRRTQLSGGQQQRVAIARALAMRPRALLFDEPTSALDPELVGEVLRVIRALAEEGRTMLIVTHEMSFAREVSNHAIYLHEGRVEEQGPPEQVFLDPLSERCRRFVGTQRGTGS